MENKTQEIAKTELGINDFIRSVKDFKIGQGVRLKNDFEELLYVAKYKKKKCLKMATCLGWRYFEPDNWNDVLPS